MARILISIDDPLCLSDDHVPDDTPVLLNSYVRVVIDAGTMEDVVEIPRAALRENAQLWTRDAEGRLRIRDVDIRWRQPESVLIADRFDPDEKLITSRLAVVVPGMRTRVGALPGASFANSAGTEPAKATSTGQAHRVTVGGGSP
jgi:hypothetical protein